MEVLALVVLLVFLYPFWLIISILRLLRKLLIKKLNEE